LTGVGAPRATTSTTSPDATDVAQPERKHSWMHDHLPTWGGRIVGAFLGAKYLGGPMAQLGLGCVGLVGAGLVGALVGGGAAQAAANHVSNASDSGSASRVQGALVGAAVGALTIGGAAAIVHGLGMSGAGGAALIGRTPANIAIEAGHAALKGAWKPALVGLALGGAVGALAPNEQDSVWSGVRDSALSWKSLALGAGVGAVIGGGLNLLSLRTGNVGANPIRGAIVGGLAFGALFGGSGAMVRVGSSAVGGSIAAVTD
jgi:hypothetical protein